MSNNTTKPMTEYDETMLFQKAYNPTEGTIAVGGFVAGKLGHRVVCAHIDAETDDFTYYDGSIILHVLRVIYSDAGHTDFVSVERTV